MHGRIKKYPLYGMSIVIRYMLLQLSVEATSLAGSLQIRSCLHYSLTLSETCKKAVWISNRHETFQNQNGPKF